MGSAIDFAILFLIGGSILGALIGKLTGRGITVSSPLLVLRRFELSPDDSEELLRIEGRATGFVSWVLTMFGLDPLTKFRMDRYSVIPDVAKRATGRRRESARAKESA